MARNLSRITNWYSKQAAWSDWHDAASRATAAGHGALVAQLQPADNAGHRRIDKATTKLCQQAGIELPYEMQPLERTRQP